VAGAQGQRLWGKTTQRPIIPIPVEEFISASGGNVGGKRGEVGTRTSKRALA